MGPTLQLFIKKNGTISLEFSIWYRLISGFMTGTFAILIFGYSTHTIPAYLLFLASLFSFLFDERWIFDPNKETVSYRLGFFFLGKKRSFPFKEVKALELSKFYKGLSPLHQETTEQKSTEEQDPLEEFENSPNIVSKTFSKSKNILKRRAKALQRLALILKNDDPIIIDIRSYQAASTLSKAASIIAEECNLKLIIE